MSGLNASHTLKLLAGLLIFDSGLNLGAVGESGPGVLGLQRIVFHIDYRGIFEDLSRRYQDSGLFRPYR